jgi:benzoyl-CoA-dihydrodiol lyase
MLDAEEEPHASITLSAMNFGPLPAVHQQSRLGARFYGDAAPIERLYAKVGERLSPRDALEAGLVTAAPDSLDWDDELRQAIETRTALSPDALTGMEQNLRFGLAETVETQVFGRLSAWQNWIFIRPNAVGASGALKVYGTGAPSKFNWERV